MRVTVYHKGKTASIGQRNPWEEALAAKKIDNNIRLLNVIKLNKLDAKEFRLLVRSLPYRAILEIYANNLRS